jgi:hypothetical protein
MKESTRQVYHCGYCKEYYLRKNAAEKHETYCRLNPENIHKCWGCENLEYGKEENGEPYPRMVTYFKCKHTGEHMYSYIAERRDIPLVNGEIRMPLECEHYKHKIGF